MSTTWHCCAITFCQVGIAFGELLESDKLKGDGGEQARSYHAVYAPRRHTAREVIFLLFLFFMLFFYFYVFFIWLRFYTSSRLGRDGPAAPDNFGLYSWRHFGHHDLLRKPSKVSERHETTQETPKKATKGANQVYFTLHSPTESPRHPTHMAVAREAQSTKEKIVPSLVTLWNKLFQRCH